MNPDLALGVGVMLWQHGQTFDSIGLMLHGYSSLLPTVEGRVALMVAERAQSMEGDRTANISCQLGAKTIIYATLSH